MGGPAGMHANRRGEVHRHGPDGRRSARLSSASRRIRAGIRLAWLQRPAMLQRTHVVGEQTQHANISWKCQDKLKALSFKLQLPVTRGCL